MASAVVAAVKLICKERQDSFVETEKPESVAWDDSQIFEDKEGDEVWEPPAKDWLTSLRVSSRSTSNSTKPKRRTKEKSVCYGDENRRNDSNVDGGSMDRREAMKLATNPVLAAVAEMSPRFSDIARPIFGASKTPRQCSMTSSCRGPQPAWMASPRSRDDKSPQTGKSVVAFPSPRRGSGTPSFPAPPSFASSIERSDSWDRRPSFPSSPSNSFSLGDRVSSQRTLKSRRSPLRAVAESPSHRVAHSPSHRMAHSSSHHLVKSPSYASSVEVRQLVKSPSRVTSVEVTPAENVLVYQPRGAASPRAPADLQPRDRCRPAAESRTAALAATPVGSSMSIAWKDVDYLAKRRVLPAGSQDSNLQRVPSHDIAGDSSVALSPRKVYGSVSGSQTPDAARAPSRLFGKITLGDQLGLGEMLTIPAKRKEGKKKASRSRSASIFWQPPPEAAVICETVRSPSFLLHARGEAQAGVVPACETDVDISDIADFMPARCGPQPASLGSSSSQAVVSVMCTTIGNQMTPRPQTSSSASLHQSPRPLVASFSYARHRQPDRWQV